MNFFKNLLGGKADKQVSPQESQAGNTQGENLSAAEENTNKTRENYKKIAKKRGKKVGISQDSVIESDAYMERYEKEKALKKVRRELRNSGGMEEPGLTEKEIESRRKSFYQGMKGGLKEDRRRGEASDEETVMGRIHGKANHENAELGYRKEKIDEYKEKIEEIENRDNLVISRTKRVGFLSDGREVWYSKASGKSVDGENVEVEFKYINRGNDNIKVMAVQGKRGKEKMEEAEAKQILDRVIQEHDRLTLVSDRQKASEKFERENQSDTSLLSFS